MSSRFAPLLLALALAACEAGRDPGTVPCTPGEALEVGCASACGLGSCTGDPVLRVCDGDVDVRACADATSVVAESDDACGTLCPRTRVACPASGRITVIHRAFEPQRESTCAWSVRPGASAATRDAGP